jgi:hypothetical protein
LEAYLGIAISILAFVLPGTWWLKLILMCIVGIPATDIALRHPITIDSHWLKRTSLAIVAMLVLAGITFKPILAVFGEIRGGGPIWDVESGGTACVLVSDCQWPQSGARLKLKP